MPFFEEGNKLDYTPERLQANGATNGASNGLQNGNSANVKREPETGINVVIAGAGLGGLMAAMECWRKGHNVRIYERNSGPTFSGDTIGIQPGALVALDHWPEAKKEVEEAQIDCDLSYRRQGGDLIFGPSQPMFNDEENRKDRGGPHVGFAQLRAKLWQTLLKQVAKIGIEIQYDKRVSDYFEDNDQGKGGVVFDDGSVALGDVVIAADGLKTQSSKIVLGGSVEPRESGMAIYRCAYPIEHALKEPLVKERYLTSPNEKPVWHFYLGPGMHSMAVLHDDMACWALTHRDVDGSARESWDPKITPDEVLEEMKRSQGEWDPALVALMRTAPKGSIVHWKLMWRDLHSTWHSPGGRVVQIGDSAHSFLPASGNGGTQAMEDAVTLATCLQLAGRERAALATKVYNVLRYQRVSCAQKLSFVNSQTLHQTDWGAIEKTPSLIRTKFCKWIYNHNPEAYAYEKFGQALHHVLTGAPFTNTNLPPGHKFRAWTIDEVKKDIQDGKRLTELLDGDWT